MDVNSMVTEVAAHGYDDAVALARIAPLLDIEHKRLCGMAAWPFTEATLLWTPTVVALNVPVPGAPTNIQYVRTAEMPAYNQTLSYLRRDIIRKQYGGGLILNTDLPMHYYLYGFQFYVWPNIPIGATLQLAVDFHQKPLSLVAGVTEAQVLLPAEFHGLLIDRVVARMARAEGDLTDGDTYDNRANSQLQELYSTFDVNMDSPDPIIQVNDYDWLM